MAKPHRQPILDPVLAPRVTAAHGERRLVRAVFEAAAADLREHAGARTRHGQEIYAEARSWFESDVHYTAGYSFLRCCEVLDLEPSAVRAAFLPAATAPSCSATPKG